MDHSHAMLIGMRKPLLALFMSLIIATSAYSVEDCSVSGESIEGLMSFIDEANEVTGAMTETQKVLGVTVTKFGTNQGSGKVSVLTDEKGNLTGVRVDFTLKGKKVSMVKTFEELKNGEKLEYNKGSETIPALVVQKAYGSDIYPGTGGKFMFSILAKKPKSYKNYNMFLRKEGGVWIVKNENGTRLNSVDLTPNVSGMDWNGTFSEAEFE